MTPIVCAQPSRALSPAAPVLPYIRTARGRPASRRIPSPPECLPRVTPRRSAVKTMPRAVPSDWRPKGIELLEVRQLYDASTRLTLLVHLGASSATIQRRIEFLNGSMNAAAWLRAELYYAKKPSQAQIKAAVHPVEEPAWRALSTTAQALYPWLKLEWRGPDANNNGKIRLSVRQAALRVGVIPETAARAFHDLQRKGFIVQTEAGSLGIEGAARAPAYELTEIKMPVADQADGRKLYREWRPDREFPVPTVSANNPLGRNGRKAKPRHENHDATVMKTMTDFRGLS